MIKKHYYLMVDTETCGDLENPYVYDLGMQVIDRQGKVYAQCSLVIFDVFVGMYDLMKTAYYSNKIPQYITDINGGKRKICYWVTAKRIIKELFKKYDITAVIAHNARFDYKALNNTATYFNCGKKSYVFPYGTPIWCTLTMARQIFWNKPMYKRFCDENNYYTSTGKMRLTAEILYRFITRNNNFVESHTGLEDVEIEKEIFLYMLRQHKKMQRTYYKPKE